MCSENERLKKEIEKLEIQLARYKCFFDCTAILASDIARKLEEIKQTKEE